MADQEDATSVYSAPGGVVEDAALQARTSCYWLHGDRCTAFAELIEAQKAFRSGVKPSGTLCAGDASRSQRGPACL